MSAPKMEKENHTLNSHDKNNGLEKESRLQKRFSFTTNKYLSTT